MEQKGTKGVCRSGKPPIAFLHVLIVDRSVESRSGHIVIAIISGELTVKRLIKGDSGWLLKAEHPDYPPTKMDPDAECSIWGVVTGSVRRFVP